MSASDNPEVIAAAAQALAAADALLVTAGAGLGVDSGLPDFRGDQGFWRAYPALGRRGLGFTTVASPQTFSEDPALAWGFYGHRLALYRRTQPHAGFALLRAWGQRLPQGVAVYTSNVDGHFQRSGFLPGRVAECHGSIHHLQCLGPCHDGIWPADDFIPELDEAACRLLNAPPRCPRCGGLARPNILMFGDSGWLGGRSEAQESRLQHWLQGRRRLLVLELGAGTAIPSVRHFGQQALLQSEGLLVRVNPREAAVARRCDLAIGLPALQALQAIDAVLNGL